VCTLEVQKSFRGPENGTVKVFTEDSSGGFPLEVGKDYLLFAQDVGGRLTITNCGNSSLLVDARDRVRQLRKVQIPLHALIKGRISFSGIPDSGMYVAGVEIVVRSKDKTFAAVCDQIGWFHLHVRLENIRRRSSRFLIGTSLHVTSVMLTRRIS
jgi:hypothetical protein